jgi:hypothetical protein
MTPKGSVRAARRNGRCGTTRPVLLEELEPRLVLSPYAGLAADGELIVDPVNKGDSVPLKEFVGVFRDGTWYLDQDDQGMAAEDTALFGVPGDKPLVGYFDDDGHAELAVVRDGVWMFDLDARGGKAERVFAFGLPEDVPLVGKWLADGSAKRSVERPAVFRNGLWFFDDDGNGGAAERAFAFGIPGDVPVAGDFDGDGLTDAAVFRSGVWHLDLDRAGGAAERTVVFGLPGDQPLAGDWDGDGIDDLAVKRGSMWYFDLDGNGGMAEKAFAFGYGGDLAVAGSWQGTGAGNQSDGATTDPGADPGSSTTLTAQLDERAELSLPPLNTTEAALRPSPPVAPRTGTTDHQTMMTDEDNLWDAALLEQTGQLVLLSDVPPFVAS